MKVTVRDVTNIDVNVRDYMNYDEETGRIYVDLTKLDEVLIDKTEEWERLKEENKRYREYLELIRATGTLGRIISTNEVLRSDEANLADEALEVEE